MSELIEKVSGEFTTNTKIIADMLKTGDKKRDEAIHRDIIKTMSTQIFSKVDSVTINLCSHTGNELRYVCSITNATFTESIFNFGKGNKRTASMI